MKDGNIFKKKPKKFFLLFILTSLILISGFIYADWYNSPQDWNDGMNDSIVNSTLYHNKSYSTYSGLDKHWAKETTFYEGKAQVDSSGTEGGTFLQLKQDFNDGKDYNVTFNATFSTHDTGGNTAFAGFSFVKHTSFIGNQLNITFGNHLWVYAEPLGVIKNEIYTIFINQSEDKAYLYNKTSGLMNSTTLGSSDIWYLRIFGFVSGADSSYTQYIRIYNITTKSSGANVEVSLISPSNSTSDGNYSRFYRANISMDNPNHRILNSTLLIWNSTNQLIYNSTTNHTGTNWSEILNKSATIPYGNFTWNYKSCGNDSSKVDCDSAVNYSIELKDLFNPNVTINSPSGSGTSFVLTINITSSDYGGLGWCNYSIFTSAGGDTGINNKNISNCKNTTATLSILGDYNIWVQVNDTANNINVTNQTFSIISTGGGGGAGTGALSPIATIIKEPLCLEYKENFFDLWERSGDDSFSERIKFVWNSFWDYTICGSASSIVPYINEN